MLRSYCENTEEDLNERSFLPTVQNCFKLNLK